MIEFKFKSLIVLVLFMALTMSCNQKHKEADMEKIAENYISALNKSDYNRLAGLFADSVRFNEMEYIRTFSKEGYRSLFQWDSVFAPEYQILDMAKEGEKLHLKISKTCDRIRFLHEAPFISNEIMEIKDGGIHRIEIVEYVDFNDSLWVAKREKLVSWIDENHPELNGFIYDQTKEGAIKYQKAMEFYKNRKDSITVQ